MIVNLPSSEALNTTALKLYFRAWHGIVGILHEFDAFHDGSVNEWVEPSDDLFQDERAEYLDFAQENMHALASVAQQSNELALKARIAAVSPYLLLLNCDVNLTKTTSTTIEFASLRTMDAVDLPKAVNALTPTPVSDAYMQRYTEMRIQRNRYAHLGDTAAALDPVSMCSDLITQYLELWFDRAWLSDRVAFSYSSESFFDGKHWSPLHSILYLLEYDRALIPSADFKKLFGAKKADVKFGCFSCQDDWAVSRNGPTIIEAQTAFYNKTNNAMRCLICNSDFNAILQTCDACGGKFAAPDNAQYGAGSCFSCGEQGAG